MKLNTLLSNSERKADEKRHWNSNHSGFSFFEDTQIKMNEGKKVSRNRSLPLCCTAKVQRCVTSGLAWLLIETEFIHNREANDFWIYSIYYFPFIDRDRFYHVQRWHRTSLSGVWSSGKWAIKSLCGKCYQRKRSHLLLINLNPWSICPADVKSTLKANCSNG